MDKQKELFLALAEGKTKADLKFPAFRAIPVEILGVNLQNMDWKCIHVKILDDNLTKEEDVWQDALWSEGGSFVKQQVPYKEDRVLLEYISNYYN